MIILLWVISLNIGLIDYIPRIKAVGDPTTIEFKLSYNGNSTKAPPELLETVHKLVVEASVTLQHAIELLVTSTAQHRNTTFFIIVVTHKHIWKVAAVVSVTLHNLAWFKIWHGFFFENDTFGVISTAVGAFDAGNIAIIVEANLESSAGTVELMTEVPCRERVLLRNAEVGAIDRQASHAGSNIVESRFPGTCSHIIEKSRDCCNNVPRLVTESSSARGAFL
mmetsp:Transcript_5191/g.11280  ORF Transcript_5191/g.11280 Transcript_5191/m.11280 type:complete len:223 (-) Transcript_5191:530-1198(-)